MVCKMLTSSNLRGIKFPLPKGNTIFGGTNMVFNFSKSN
jgi:hypothetical protein